MRPAIAVSERCKSQTNRMRINKIKPQPEIVTILPNAIVVVAKLSSGKSSKFVPDVSIANSGMMRYYNVLKVNFSRGLSASALFPINGAEHF